MPLQLTLLWRFGLKEYMIVSCVHSLSVGIRVVLNTCGYSCSDPEKENMQLGFHFMIEIIKMPSKLF